jgi:hypothetical protein
MIFSLIVVGSSDVLPMVYHVVKNPWSFSKSHFVPERKFVPARGHFPIREIGEIVPDRAAPRHAAKNDHAGPIGLVW